MDDLLGEFLSETQESMDELDNEIVRFEQNPEDEETLAKVFRVVHTIKGTCGFLNLPRLERVSHAAENLLSQFRNHTLEVTPERISKIFTALDRIKMILATLNDTGQEPEGDDQDVISALGIDSPAPKPVAPVEPAAVEPAAVEPKIEISKTAEPEPSKPQTEKAPEEKLQAEPKEEKSTGEESAEKESTEKESIEAFQMMTETEPSSAPSVDRTFSSEPPSAIDTAMLSDSESDDAISRAYQAWQMVVDRGPSQHKAHKSAAPKADTKKQPTGSNVPKAAQTLRLNIDLVESLMNMVSELVLTRNRLMSLIRETGQEQNDFNSSIQQLNLITSELQEGVMKTRMQPISNAWAKLPRVVRDLSRELDKPLDLKMIGAETELDRQVLEIIKDPLLHMVRNAADHGIEEPNKRHESGKPESGTITLNAYHEGGHIVIEVSDDGKGLNADSIRKKIIDLQIVNEAEAKEKSHSELFKYIFHPGFSTADNVTAISGRGVGMDVVKSNIDSINGSVEVRSSIGIGSTFIIKIPLTLAIVSALIVTCGDESFAIPQINIVEIVQIGKGGDQRIETIEGMPILRLREQLLPIVALSDILNIEDKLLIKKHEMIRSLNQEKAEDSYKNTAEKPEEIMPNGHDPNPQTEESNPPIEESNLEETLAKQLAKDLPAENSSEQETFNTNIRTHLDGDDPLGEEDLSKIYKDSFVVILRASNNVYGLIVEDVSDMQEIVVKPTSRILSNVSYFGGNTILGDGSVIMILDPNGIAMDIGDLSIGDYAADDDDDDDLHDGMGLSLMLFKTTENIVKAVPLGVIGRLEDIDFAKVEYPGGKPTIQYRDTLMPIIDTRQPFIPPKSGHGSLLVFSDQKRSMGLVVSEIIDIVEENIDITMTANTPGYIGSTVIDGKAIDIIDAEYYWNQAFVDHLGNSFSNRGAHQSSLRILLIDDSRFYRDMIMPYLSALGFTVVTAYSTEDAMAYYRQGDKFDVILSNLSTSRDKIYSFVRTIRDRGPWASMPIFGLAENIDDIDAESGYMTGFTDFIPKNDRATLLESLKNLYNAT